MDNVDKKKYYDVKMYKNYGKENEKLLLNINCGAFYYEEYERINLKVCENTQRRNTLIDNCVKKFLNNNKDWMIRNKS